MMAISSSPNETATAINIIPPVPKRGRGRPRKNGSYRSLCNNIYVTSFDTKPRGRPKKSMEEYLKQRAVNKYIYGITEPRDEDMFEDVEDSPIIPDGIDESGDSGIPAQTTIAPSTPVAQNLPNGIKKRGRPRIHPPKIKIPGRGRGRPRKDANLQVLQNNILSNGRSNGHLTGDFQKTVALKPRVSHKVESVGQRDSMLQTAQTPVKRKPGRPRIHPPKIKIPGRGRGRPRKIRDITGDEIEPGEINIKGFMNDFQRTDSLPQEDLQNYKQEVLKGKADTTISGLSTQRSVVIDSSSILKSPTPTKTKFRIKGLIRVGSHLPGMRPKPAADPSFSSACPGPFSAQPTTGSPGKRPRGRPRIHPPKIKVPGRGRGRPPKSPDQKAQTVRARLLRRAIETSNRRAAADDAKPPVLVPGSTVGSPDTSKQVIATTSTAQDPNTYPTLAIKMVGSLQPLYPICDGTSLSANIATQEHASYVPVPIAIKPVVDYDNNNTVDSQPSDLPTPQIDNLVKEKREFEEKVQRLTDLVEVKNTAIEHLKVIVESLGGSVSPFVMDALNATVVNEEENKSEPECTNTSEMNEDMLPVILNSQ